MNGPNGNGPCFRLASRPSRLRLKPPSTRRLFQQYGCSRDVNCDWGELPIEDLAANNLALMAGRRILSNYALPSGEKVWVITEADRSTTTILLPEGY
ncbi:hypothetical protein [Paraburkholderia sp. BL9I2N2]|uniref:hypothetical protein n=1 Tax=Paraburkholderia sp. BL9I2N2 TaxID=1938809 RepID=UPI0010DFA628|nr:hypothetical protein B0G74_3832 [Paraburkholderia sp. BL9I2N2]